MNDDDDEGPETLWQHVRAWWAQRRARARARRAPKAAPGSRQPSVTMAEMDRVFRDLYSPERVAELAARRSPLAELVKKP